MRHRLEYYLVRVVTGFVRVMPWTVSRSLGALLGLAAYWIDGAHRRVAMANLAAAFPHRSMRETRKVARGVFKHFGRALFDLLKFSTLTPQQMLASVEFQGEDRVRQAYAQGRGVLFYTGHFGSWEQIAIVLAVKFEPVEVLARPLDNPDLNALLERLRSSTGGRVIYRRGAIRRVMRVLSRGHAVGMLVDQHLHGPDAVWVDFFGRPAATTTALAAIALRTGAPVVPMFAVPLPGGGFRVMCEHPVEPPAADSPDAVREFTQRCTDVLEMYVRRYPDMWLWMHRRWRAPEAATSEASGLLPGPGQDLPADA